MAGEVSPADGGTAQPPAPALRASDADRERTVDILRVAAGDGRLTAAELDERVEVALTARTAAELAALTADLPATPGLAGPAPQAKELIRIERFGGNDKRVGRWVVPHRMEIKATGGNVTLDFTEAVITQPALRLGVQLHGGNLVLVTRPGIEVDTDELAMAGGNVKIKPAQGPQPPALLTVEITGRIFGGNLVARPPRPPRRTFLQWLLRRPRPAAPAGQLTGR
jgi:hypothetical protein